MLTSFYKLAHTCTRQDITTFQSKCFSTAEHCLISCVEECSPKHRHVLTSFYKLAHTSTRQDITIFQSRCFPQQQSYHWLCRRCSPKHRKVLQGPVVQSVVSPTADPWVVTWTTAQSHTFMEFDHEIISTVILLLPVTLLLPLIQEELLSVTSKSMCTKYWLTA